MKNLENKIKCEITGVYNLPNLSNINLISFKVIDLKNLLLYCLNFENFVEDFHKESGLDLNKFNNEDILDRFEVIEPLGHFENGCANIHMQIKDIKEDRFYGVSLGYFNILNDDENNINLNDIYVGKELFLYNTNIY